MKLINNIKRNHRLKVLSRLTYLPHQRRIMNLDDIRSIGIIAHYLDASEQAVVNQFCSQMEKRGIHVEKIEMPVEADTLLDHWGLPSLQYIHPFVHNHYDLLIDTTQYNDCFGLFVSLKSDSYLRTCYHDSTIALNPLAQATYDLIIQGSGPRNLQQYFNDTLSYLTQIKK